MTTQAAPQRLLFRSLLILSVVLMVVGHMLIITSGRWFIPGKMKYDLFERWVSDFAAVWPHGWWIKGAILLFCAALMLHGRSRCTNLGTEVHHSMAWYWQVTLTAGMIIGLLLVIFYDMSPPRFTYQEPSAWERFWGKEGEWKEVEPTARQLTGEAHHRIGFRIFVASFIAALITSIVSCHRLREARQKRFFIVLLVFALIAGFWLYTQRMGLAGIPQRALLVTVFVWLWIDSPRKALASPAVT